MIGTKLYKEHRISSSMEEPKPPVIAPTLQTPSSKKRPLDTDNSNSNYFKIRALIRDLRPHFIQVHYILPPFSLNTLNPIKIFSFSWNASIFVVILSGFFFVHYCI